MTATARTLHLTPEEYFAWEEGQLERHEYHYGEVHAMSGGTYAHARLNARLSRLLGNALDGSECVVLSEAMRVEVERAARYVYPDLTVVCGPPEFVTAAETTLVNPTLVAEVLSPSTAAYDRGEKLADAGLRLTLYRAVASLREVAFVSSEKRWVEVARRTAAGGTIAAPVTEGAVALESVGASVDLGELYVGVA